MKIDKYNISLIIVVMLFFFIRVVGLKGETINTDSYRWYVRSRNFLQALKIGDLKSTYQRYHPGVTLMYENSFVQQIWYKYKLETYKRDISFEDKKIFSNFDYSSRIFNISILTVLFCVQLFLIKNIFNYKTSLIYGLFVCTEPYLIGIDRWFHLTSLEVSFGFTSVLFMMMWKKKSRFMYLPLSGFFLSLALLTKVTQVFLTPVFIYLIVSQNKNIKASFKYFFVWLFTVMLISFICWPALWFNFDFVFMKMFSHLFNAVSDDAHSLLIDPIISPFYYSITILLKMSFVSLILFLVSFVCLRKSKEMSVVSIYVCIFSLFIFLGVSSQKIDRYVISFLPYFLILGSVYLSKFSNVRVFGVVFINFVFFAYSVFTFYPVYSSFYSPIFGGIKKAISLGIYDNSGEYYVQAANYLNAVNPISTVAIPESFDSFAYVYKGNVQRQVDDNTRYLVTSIDTERLGINKTKKDKCLSLLNTFGPQKVQVVLIYECNYN